MIRVKNLLSRILIYIACFVTIINMCYIIYQSKTSWIIINKSSGFLNKNQKLIITKSNNEKNLDRLMNYGKFILENDKIDVMENKLYAKYLLRASDRNYFNSTFGLNSLITVIIWKNDVDFRLRNYYYDYMSNNCDNLKTDLYGGRFGLDTYNLRCFSNDFDAFRRKKNLSDIVFNIGLPNNSLGYLRHMWKRNNTDFPLSYIHIVRNAFVNHDGDVWFDDYKILPQRCKQLNSLRKPFLGHYLTAVTYDEVFVLVQFWSDGYFHFMVENLPRLMPYFDWLLRNSQIKILMAEPKYEKNFRELISALNIPKNRIIHNNYVNAKILYYPAGGTCGMSPIYGTQLLAQRFGSLDENLNGERYILLIKRSSPKRQWRRHKQILKAVIKISHKYNLKLIEYADNPSPSFSQTIQYFSKAKVILSPHGAGLSNIIWAPKDAIIIEGLCNIDGKRSNLCYRNLCSVLGLRWYGFSPGCLNMKETDLDFVIRKSLDLKETALK